MTAASSAVHRRHSKGSLGGCWKGGPVILCIYFDCEMWQRFFSKSSPRFWMNFTECLEKKRPLPNDTNDGSTPKDFQHQFPPPNIQVADAGKGRQTRQMPNGNWCNTRPTLDLLKSQQRKEMMYREWLGHGIILKPIPNEIVVLDLSFSNGVQIPTSDFLFVCQQGCGMN